MEGAAPLDQGSGGTPTAMVAVPMLSTAVGQRFSILGGTGTGTKMEASIHLRAKDIAAHERWLANLADVITSNGLDDTPTAMVAVPVLNSALEQRLSILGGTGVGTKMDAYRLQKS